MCKNDKPQKCSKWNPCWIMESMLSPPNGGHPTGLSMYVVTQLKTMHQRHVAFIFKRSQKKADKPMILNFCPFCGANVQFHDEGYDDPPVKLGEKNPYVHEKEKSDEV